MTSIGNSYMMTSAVIPYDVTVRRYHGNALGTEVVRLSNGISHLSPDWSQYWQSLMKGNIWPQSTASLEFSPLLKDMVKTLIHFVY